MNIQWNMETFILISAIVLSTIGLIFILKVNWKQYGLLFIISAAVGEFLCYVFVKLGLYSYPYRLFPRISLMPFAVILTVFPFYVLFGVRFSPIRWAYKIPFYWVLVHLGMLAEVMAQNFTSLIKYKRFWDTWDSYTWWWIFLLVFEWVGGMVVSQEYRKPIDESLLKYGKVGWFIIHFILIVTIFLAGLYMGIRVS